MFGQPCLVIFGVSVLEHGR
uniref:Uncharacterized protein n=1 Tax=Rhizophora mucronata TaxID=61149 RepID=A0A2P2NX02_RHIMU